ncbi:MAG: tripartite tricarboxylate transporter substrate binding protein [Bosea sp.]|uniref:Bug family tripartite tricarboxylate transporter substrate binding protein n=1 Tax=Bosea sp. (in: a-proteobacteria) TaxID=1871050 RepID=UPI001AD09D30|nr:tripartite tricarboxylate transporter substrate binding protein [Bosea sp. (in: a-proteobacteria)]MBN9470765.1 tripartite tricarboxylate transporter substrate binding protein [Bosea sp. (in: a-proteobacteria)]
MRRIGIGMAFGLVAALGCTSMAGSASAQQWPERQVTIIVPSAPGDGSDIAARLIAEKLKSALGQPFVIENRLGAGGVVGSAAAARAAPDGYTFIMGNAGSHGINAATYANIPYDVMRDFTPVSLVYKAPNIFIASTKLPVKSMAELISYAKANPGKLSYASGGSGSSAHMNSEYLKVLTGIEATHVPYRGAGPALNDIVSGQVEFMAVNLPPAIGLVTSGQVTPLAVTTAKRAPALPNVPTVAESGFAGYETVAWFGLLGPQGVPPAIVERMHAEIVKACADTQIQEKLAVLGGETVCNSPAEFKAFLAADIARWKDVAGKAGVTLQAQ